MFFFCILLLRRQMNKLKHVHRTNDTSQIKKRKYRNEDRENRERTNSSHCQNSPHVDTDRSFELENFLVIE